MDVRWWVALVLCASFARGWAQTTPEDNDALQQADALFAKGRVLMADRNFADACASFEAAIKLDPKAPGTMLNLGLCNLELQRSATALKWFRRAQTRASEAGLREHEDSARRYTAQLAKVVPAIKIELVGRTTDTRVTIDGATIEATDLGNIELDPGTHSIDVRASRKHEHREVTIGERDRKAVTIDLRDPVRRPSNIPTYVMITGGVLGLAGLAYDLVALRPARARLADATTMAEYEAEHGTFRTRQHVTVGLFAGAAIAAATGFVLQRTVFRHRKTALAVIVGRDAAIVGVEWRQ